jgi:ubiquinone/menaquinone biosynthesis C-methylase UbiE
MDCYRNFSPKADIYANYRWNYNPVAIAEMCQIAGVSKNSVVADIGSGTGMLTSYLLSKVKQIYAIEPNAEMRAIARQNLAHDPAFISVDALASATTLPDNSIDLIAVGRAIHWFNPETARPEFRRIFKPNGWLAICQVPYEDLELLEAVKSLKKEEYGWNIAQDKFQLTKDTNLIAEYFHNNNYKTIKYSSVVKENWQEFMGRICSISVAPNTDNDLFSKFELEAKKIFEHYSSQGILTIKNATEIKLGKLNLANRK